MNKKKYISQLFEVETNTIITTDLDPAISIDHMQKLNAGIRSVLTMLGLTEMTPMTAGTQVKQYKYNKKNTPAQVAEGEVIGLTAYERKLVNTFDLALEKFRKQTTAEAIQRVGRGKAIDDTDTLLEREVQKSIKSKFFTMINVAEGANGATAISARARNTLTDLQKVLAAIWGQMSVYFADMDVSPVYFVNNLDIADYLANAQVTVQNAFGFKYIEDFLGLGTVIIDPSVTAGNVRGTVKENLNGVYVPASGDVASTFGLTFDSTGLVGMKHFLADDRASVDTLIMTGATFYAEDVTGIFSGTIVGNG